MRALISLTSTMKFDHLQIAICDLNNIKVNLNENLKNERINEVFVNKEFFKSSNSYLFNDLETESDILIAHDTSHFEIRIFNQSPSNLRKLTENIAIRIFKYGKLNGFQQKFGKIMVFEDNRHKFSIYDAYFGLNFKERLTKTTKDKLAETFILIMFILIFILSAMFFNSLFHKWLGALFAAILIQLIQFAVHFYRLGNSEKIHWEIPK